MKNTIYLPRVEMIYTSLNNTDQLIANFFFTEAYHEPDLSAKHVSQLLHISESSLTRFAQKCGYDGYRQLIYDVESNKTEYPSDDIKPSNVLADYSTLLKKVTELTQDQHFQHICEDIASQKDIYIYGVGHSGLAAKEIELRFNRIGIRCKVVTDREQILVNYAVLGEDCLVIALSLSGENTAILKALELASAKGAKTYILTTQRRDYTGVDEIIAVPSVFNLDYGNRISPQFPLLVVIDLIYDYLMQTNRSLKSEIFETTLDILNKKGDDITNG